MAYLQRDQSEAELVSMSSRLDWWATGYKMFMQHPFTGLGAYAGSRFAVLTNVGAPQLHSDWLEVIVGTSIWGLAPFVISLVWIWAILIRYYRGHWLSVEDRQLTLEMIGVMTDHHHSLFCERGNDLAPSHIVLDHSRLGRIHAPPAEGASPHADSALPEPSPS